jgi:pimeloyl-ACP methyl ester carboxylesterase
MRAAAAAAAGPAVATARPTTIVFSHANGFPAGTYETLFERWRAAGHRVLAMPMFGHDPRYPVTSNWPKLRDQLLDYIDDHVAQPAVLVGHSLGGVLSVLAASRRPAAARGVVLLDAPVITGWRAHTVRAIKLSGLMKRFSPGRVSSRRRYDWPSREAVHLHFAAKPAFARWDPRVLADYVEAGFADQGDRVRLAFDRDIETRIYDTLPHHMGQVLRRHPLRCPVALVVGTRSAEMRQAGLASVRRLVRDRLIAIEGTHLFPMEKPDATADAVLRLIAGLA